MEIELTDDEQKAINSLQRLGRKWPKTLLVFGGAQGCLSVRKPAEDGRYGRSREVASIPGIPNDGGDGGDEF